MPKNSHAMQACHFTVIPISILFLWVARTGAQDSPPIDGPLPPPPSRFLPYPGAGISLSYFDPQSRRWVNDFPLSQVTRDPLVLLIHGWRSDVSETWITDFVAAAYDPHSGALANRPEVQVISVNWPQRAGQGWPWQWQDAWRGGRNGFADGAAFGLHLATHFFAGGVDPSVVHIIGHSNGGGFGAGVAWSFCRRTSSPIAQLTALDTPSTTPYDWFTTPPTGYLVQEAVNCVSALDSWYDDEHVTHGDSFGDQYIGSNVSAFDLSELRTKQCLNEGIMHRAIPLRYARSANGQQTEAYGFAARSAALRSVRAEGLSRERVSVLRCASPRTEWHSYGNTVKGPTLLLENPIEFTSRTGSWYGHGAYATGSPVEPSFVLRRNDGGYLSVEFEIEAAGPIRAISFRVDLIGRFYDWRDKLFVYVTDGSRDAFEFVAVRDLDWWRRPSEEVWLPGAPASGVLTVALVVPDNGWPLRRELRITEVQAFDVLFGVE